MAEKARYRTRQRELVENCLTGHSGAYFTVDEVLASIKSEGSSIGRTTVYRALENMTAEGKALKACVPGGEASYRITEEDAAGQLVCLECGNVFPLDCHTAADLAEHVLDHHGFAADPSRTVLYGKCAACMEAARED